MLAQRAPVLDRLGDVGAADVGMAGQVGDGAGHLQHPVVGPGRPVQADHRGAQLGRDKSSLTYNN